MNVVVPSGGRLARTAIVLLALAALVLTVRTGLGFGLSARHPAIAARIDASNGGAIAALAETRMLSARSDADVGDVERLARAALTASPLEASALRNVGFVLAVTGREPLGRQLLTLAGEASLRDYLTHAWLLNDHFARDRVVEAIREADIVLRQDVSVWPVVMPELARLLADRRAIDPLARRLATKPYWRGSFLQTLAADGVDREAGYALLQRLKTLGAPASTTESQPWLLSVAESDPRLLYRRWTALLAAPLPASQARLRDGGFEGLDAPAPFNWSFYPRDGVYAERSSGPDRRGGALYLSFDGTGIANFATQKLVLPAGRYRLTGRVYGDGAVDAGRFAAQFRCGENGAELARVPLEPGTESWTRFELDVTVTSSCPAQHVWFVGSAGESLDPAAIWVDDLALNPLG